MPEAKSGTTTEDSRVVCTGARHIVNVTHWEQFALPPDTERAQARPFQQLGIIRRPFTRPPSIGSVERLPSCSHRRQGMSCGSSVTQPITNKVGMSVTDLIDRVSMFSTGATSPQNCSKSRVDHVSTPSESAVFSNSERTASVALGLSRPLYCIDVRGGRCGIWVDGLALEGTDKT